MANVSSVSASDDIRVPRELLQELGWKSGQKVQLVVAGDELRITAFHTLPGVDQLKEFVKLNEAKRKGPLEIDERTLKPKKTKD